MACYVTVSDIPRILWFRREEKNIPILVCVIIWNQLCLLWVHTLFLHVPLICYTWYLKQNFTQDSSTDSMWGYKILCFDGGNILDCCRLYCDAVQSCRCAPSFQKKACCVYLWNVWFEKSIRIYRWSWSPLQPGSINQPISYPIHLDPESGGSVFFWNFGTHR
jgi:hypothetical protein